MKKAVWLSFDLGVGGDYEGLYTWLANKKATECGDGLAFFSTELGAEQDLVAKLKHDIENNINITKKTRIYAIYRDGEHKVKGSFLVGKRHQAPWAGFGSIAEESMDELEVE